MGVLGIAATKRIRRNEELTAVEVRVIDSAGDQAGVMALDLAIQLARDEGLDLVEVSPPYDTSGNTALVGANIMFEMLSILPGVKYR